VVLKNDRFNLMSDYHRPFILDKLCLKPFHYPSGLIGSLELLTTKRIIPRGFVRIDLTASRGHRCSSITCYP